MTIQERTWNIGATVGVLLVVFLAVLSVKEIKSIGYVGKSDQVVNTISVNGTGDAVAIPDIATFSFTVTETGKTVAEAQSAATAKNNAALKAVREAGVADKDIQTTSYDINPHYDYQNGVCNYGACPPGKSVLTGYDVSQMTTIKVRDLAKAGDIFSTIGSLGVQNVNGLTFSIDKPDSVKAEARGKAIDDARSKADVIARQLGVSLVRVVSFSDSSDQGYPVPYAMGVSARDLKSEATVAPQIAVGEKKVTSNVTITYEIK